MEMYTLVLLPDPELHACNYTPHYLVKSRLLSPAVIALLDDMNGKLTVEDDVETDRRAALVAMWKHYETVVRPAMRANGTYSVTATVEVPEGGAIDKVYVLGVGGDPNPDNEDTTDDDTEDVSQDVDMY